MFWESIPCHEKRQSSHNDRDKTLENEDPSPSRLATHAFHIHDRRGEKATEGPSKGCSGEEDCGADTEFRAFVPTREIIVHTFKNYHLVGRRDEGHIQRTWEEACLGDSKEPTCGHETAEVVDQTHGSHANTWDFREHEVVFKLSDA